VCKWLHYFITSGSSVVSITTRYQKFMKTLACAHNCNALGKKDPSLAVAVPYLCNEMDHVVE